MSSAEGWLALTLTRMRRAFFSPPPPAGRDKKTHACQAANLSHIFTSRLFESIAVNYASFDFIVRDDGV